MRGGWRYNAGRPARHGKVENHYRIDIRRWAREGMLTEGRYFGWQWSEDGEQVAAINVRVDSPLGLTLIYRWRHNGETWRDEAIPVRLERTACNYGGGRLWFICPHCHRRSAFLYLASGKWACRHSFRLAHASRSFTRVDRLHRKKTKVENKLDGIGTGRPKGMHSKTYERLRDEWIEAEMALDDEFTIHAMRIGMF